MLCSNPNCSKPTVGPRDDPTKAVSIGVAAHITAASPQGPRCNASLSEAERCSIENGIWLCQNCGKLVDNDDGRYTIELLRSWKKQAEGMALRGVETNSSFLHSSGANLSKEYKLLPIVHAEQPNPGQAHLFCFHLQNQGTATADLIQIKVKTSEVGLPYFSREFWRMGPNHVPYSFETEGSINPGIDKRIFQVGFQQDPDAFVFEFEISARDGFPQQWTAKFSRDESRKFMRKAADRMEERHT